VIYPSYHVENVQKFFFSIPEPIIQHFGFETDTFVSLKESSFLNPSIDLRKKKTYIDIDCWVHEYRRKDKPL
jgi:hypothetical protein